jgi:hypothetical protein
MKNMRICPFVDPPQPCVILYEKPSLEYCSKCLGVDVKILEDFLKKQKV